MRSVVLAVAVLALAACQTSYPTTLLPLSGTFPVAYSGRVAPAALVTPTVQPTAEPASLGGANDSVQCKAIVIEVPMARARQWLPAAAIRTSKAAKTEVFTPDSVAFPRNRRPEEAAASCSSLGVIVPAELFDDALREGQCELVTETAEVVVRMDSTATVVAEGRRAFVQAVALKTVGNAQLVGDPEVDVFVYGHRYEFTPRRDGDRLQVAFEWHIAEPLLPIPVVQTPYGSIEAPMLVEHHLTGTAPVAEKQIFVVGALPGREAGCVQLLCVAVGIDPLGR